MVKNAKAGTIMDNAYTYDAVSNVLSVKNGAPLPQSGKAGGQMSHQYTYDALYRLASATGTYTGADSKTASYTLAMGYDNMHRITSKKQHLTQSNVQFNGSLSAGYDLTYTYQDSVGHKFQLADVQDVNYRTEGAAGEDDKVNNGHSYTYDANGNLVYINTSRVKKDGKEDEKATEQKYRWDEENRLLAADENGFVSNYWYDADGERTVKTCGEGEQIYVNSEFAGGRTNTAKFSLYVSPYLVANQGGRYTKHIYIGSQRIVSKLGDFASYGSDPRRIPYAGSEADAVSVDYKSKYASQQQVIKDNYATFNVPYNGEDNNDYVAGEGFCCNDGSMEAAQAKAMTANVAGAKAISGNFKENDDYEKMQFYYHPDHLGSSSYITNLDGEVAQHIEYVPFGEVFIEERNNTWNTPYLFNAKEFDEETGLYYYGARYYEPRLSLWMSTDPLEEKHPNINSYCYTYNNPIVFYDPNGKTGEIVYNKNGVATVYAKIYFYGSKASSKLSQQIATGIASQWNGAHASINYRGKDYKVRFRITYETISTERAEQLIKENKSARNNFARVESGGKKSSFTLTSPNTGGGNSFWFNTKDDLAHTTTPAHEFGHGLGLEHPEEDLSNSTSRPHIMIPRQTLYGSKWSIQDENGKRVVNPNSRRVTKENVDDAYWSNWGNYRNNKAVNIYIKKDGSY